MAIDASIPLQVHSLKIPTAGEVMSLKDLAVRSQINEQNLQEKQMEVQKRNNLLQITQSPGFSDPNSGTPTPQGIAAFTRIDPEGGIKLSQMAQQMNIQNMAIDEKRTAVKRNILTGYVESYERNLQLTGDKAQAEQKAREEAMSAIQEGKKSGHFAAQGFSANELEHELPPVESARTAVLAMGGKITEPPKLEHTTAINPETKKLGLFDTRTGSFRKDAQGRYIEAPPTAQAIRLEMEGKGDYSKTGEDFLQTIPQQYRGMVKKVANYEMDPKTFSTIGGSRERALAWASQYDPNFDQKEYNSRFQAVNKFNTGIQGNAVRSLNVAIQHMDTARRLGEQLNNVGSPVWNKLANEFSTQTGKAAPTNFGAVKDILADEVVKGVLGTAGGSGEREAFAKKIKDSSSPSQLSGVLDTWTELLSGQTEGLRTQYEASTGRKDFDQKLNPRTREAIAAVKGAKKESNPDIKALLDKYK